MELLFQPKTEKEIELVSIIKFNPDKKNRKKALEQLRVLNGLSKDDYLSIRSKEFYSKIANKPIGWNRFSHASIVYDNTMLKR
jgi:hypothetical protein